MTLNSHGTRLRQLPVKLALALVVSCVSAVCAAAPAATAATPAAGFTLTSIGEPTNFTPGDSSGAAVYRVTATNVGTEPSSAGVTVSDTLPSGLSAQSISLFWTGAGEAAIFGPGPFVDIGGFACHVGSVSCTLPLPMQAGDSLTMVIHLAVASGAPLGPVTNSATVSGGGAPAVTTTSANAIDPSPPKSGIQEFDTSLTGADGQPVTQAGAHPYQFTTTVEFNSELFAVPGARYGYQVFPVEDPQQLTVDLPPGLLGDPQATPQCPLATFNSGHNCPADTQIGTVSVEGANGSEGSEPLFGLQAQPGVAAEFGFVPAGSEVPIVFTASVRTGGDYGLHVVSTGIAQAAVRGVSVTIWGDPADPTHNFQRLYECPTVAGDIGTSGIATPCFGGNVPSGASPVPYLSTPTECDGAALPVTASSSSWESPGTVVKAASSLPAVTGCDSLSFDPSLRGVPDNSQAGAPAGLTVDLKTPQNDGPLPFIYLSQSIGAPTPIGVDYSPLAAPLLRDASVSLPAGMTINPSSGSGLVGCSDAQIALSSPDAGSCPDGSKIGTVQLTTPLLDHPLPGDVYVGTPQCDPCSPADAASGRMVRLFMQINDPVSGVVVKLPGSVSIDQSTGQLTATFDQNPQLPFSDLQVTFKSGPRAPLVNPSTCGPFTTTGDLAPWSAPSSGPDATPSSSFDITGCGDPKTFAPSFTAGTQSPQAGSYSPFVLSFARSDADQTLSGLTVKLPPGLSAKLAGVPLCSDQDAAAGTCPASSQVGDVQTGAGAGSEPLFLPGKAYLTGPYKGGPYGLAVVVPAIAGPFNLGTVVVRQALYIDPTTAQVTAVSDPFPTILDGIPLRIRRVAVSLDRSGFTLNPTSCDPMSIDGTLTSTGGMTAPMSSRFQVGGCQELGFSPKLKFALTGKGQTHSGQHPTLTATLTQGPGQANIQSAKVALPLSLALDTNNSSNVCNYDVAQAVHGGAVGCPASTIVGHATAVTPLLSQPLTGPVYLVQGIRFGPQGQRIHTLPSLLVPLRGQIALDLRAQSAVNGAQQLVTTFSTIPDAPVSSFSLTINGGSKGILVITGRGKSICGKPQVANANLGAQSGKAENQNPRFSTPACKGASHHKRPTHKK